MSTSVHQRGNIFFVLFAAVALVGVLGVSMSSLLNGPTRAVGEITRNTEVTNDMIAAMALLSQAAVEQALADCDLDTMIEPLPFRAPVSEAIPIGGGLLPSQIGVRKQDPWGGAYGYCTWDLGSKVLDAACGGPTGGRLPGGDTAVAPVIALISAGKDKIFQSSCVNWVNINTPLVNKPTGSDDIVKIYPYAQFMMPSGADAQLKELPDSACTPAAIGLLRMAMGMVQVCTDTGWEEVGTAAQADSSFVDVTNAVLSQQYTSNAITFSGFLNKKTLVLTGGGILVVNGSVAGTSALIQAGDTIAIRADASALPETTLTFSISVAGVKRSWNIVTRNRHPANLTITPGSAAFTVTGPAIPSYSGVQSFIVRNTGEMDTLAISSVNLTNTTNFQFRSGGSYVGDACTAQILSQNEACVIDTRAMASASSSFSGTLTVTDGLDNVSATLNGNASGWTCPLPWGGTLMEGQSVVAYQNSTVPYGNSCTSATRTCTGGALSGASYTNQTCTVQSASNCTLDGATVAHNSSYTFYSAASVSCGSTCSGISQSRTCTNGSFSGSGSYNRANCSVGACSNCTLDGATVTHGNSRMFYSATSVPCGSSCASIGQNRTCSNGTLNGSGTYSRANCNVNACSNCTLDGATVMHGTSQAFYQLQSQTPCSGTCSAKQIKSCNNGTLSGDHVTWKYANCTCSCSAQMGQSCFVETTSKTVSGTCVGSLSNCSYTITPAINCPFSNGSTSYTAGTAQGSSCGAAPAGTACTVTARCWRAGTYNCMGVCQ